MDNTAQEMVTLIKQQLAQNAGIDAVSYDGQSVKFNRAQLMIELEYWERRAAVANGKRKLWRGIDLDTAW